MIVSERKLRCALLTIGSGPVAASAYSTLKRLVNLKCVVLSRKKRSRTPILRAVREFGIWYAAQALISMLTDRIRGHSITLEAIEGDGIQHAEWSDKSDESQVIGLLQELDIECVLVCGFQHILSAGFIDAVEHCYNLHPSLLPAYKGPDPIVWGLLCRENEFGITIHEIDEMIDHGDILVQGAVAAPFIPLRAWVESRLSILVPSLLDELVVNMSTGQLAPRKQGEGPYLPIPNLENRRLFKDGRVAD